MHPYELDHIDEALPDKSQDAGKWPLANQPPRSRISPLAEQSPPMSHMFAVGALFSLTRGQF